MCHTSGLHNNYSFEDDFYVGADRLPYDKEQYFRDWIIKKTIKNPGRTFDYNNSNYNVLAWIIESVSGQTYHEFLKEHIFSKLGMNHTAFDNGQDILINTANTYIRDYGALVRVPYTNSLYAIGAGSLVTNCDDLQKWYKCLKTKDILSEHSYEIFLSEHQEHYCYGLELYGKDKYVHGGDFLGITAYTMYFFDEDLCILLLSNTGSLNQYRLGNAITEILHNRQAPLSHQPEEILCSPEELAKYTGTYLPGKIQIIQKDGKLYLVRVNENIHIELYCVGKHCFKKRYEEDQIVHNLIPDGGQKPSIWGFKRVSTQLF